MINFKPIYPPQAPKNYTLFPELATQNTAIVPIYVNPSQVVTIGMRGSVPALYLADGRSIETQFPTTAHLEYYMSMSNSPDSLKAYMHHELYFEQVTEVVHSESNVQADNRSTGDCQSSGAYFEYTPAGPIYAGPNTLPVLEIEETTWGGVLDLSSYTDKA